MESIRERRKSLGLTQSGIARELGLSQPSYSQLENGIRDIPDHLRPALSRLLRCSPVDLSNGRASVQDAGCDRKAVLGQVCVDHGIGLGDLLTYANVCRNIQNGMRRKVYPLSRKDCFRILQMLRDGKHFLDQFDQLEIRMLAMENALAGTRDTLTNPLMPKMEALAAEKAHMIFLSAQSPVCRDLLLETDARDMFLDYVSGKDPEELAEHYGVIDVARTLQDVLFEGMSSDRSSCDKRAM